MSAFVDEVNDALVGSGICMVRKLGDQVTFESFGRHVTIADKELLTADNVVELISSRFAELTSLPSTLCQACKEPN